MFQDEVRNVFGHRNVAQFAVDPVGSTRPKSGNALEFALNWMSWGAGLRATQYLPLGGKLCAVLRACLATAFFSIGDT